MYFTVGTAKTKLCKSKDTAFVGAAKAVLEKLTSKEFLVRVPFDRNWGFPLFGAYLFSAVCRYFLGPKNVNVRNSRLNITHYATAQGFIKAEFPNQCRARWGKRKSSRFYLPAYTSTFRLTRHRLRVKGAQIIQIIGTWTAKEKKYNKFVHIFGACI